MRKCTSLDMMLPVQIPAVKAEVTKEMQPMGIAEVAFAASGRYFATRNASQPKAVWIWDVQALALTCVLLHEKAVQCLFWDPSQDKLAICTGSRRCAHFSSTLLLPLNAMH